MSNITKKVLDEAAPELAAATQDEFVWVEIPDRDLTDFPFQGVGINLKHYGGPEDRFCDCGDYPKCTKTKRHKVSVEVAREINERLVLARAMDIRLFSNRRDMASLIQLVKNNPNYQYFDPNTARS